MANDQSTRVNVVVGSGSTEPPPEPGHDVSVLDLFRRIYQFFYSKTVGLIIILAVAVLVLLGVVIGQAPAGTYDDPAGKERFLEQAAEKYGGWATVLDFLGLFRVFSSPIFLVVMGLLAASIVACTVHRIPQLWQRYRSPRVHVSNRFFDKARYRGEIATVLSAEQAFAIAEQELRSKRYRVIVDEKEPTSLYADRFAWGGFGTVVAHASFIVILAAFVLSATMGIEELMTVPVAGKAQDVGHGTNLSIEAREFEATYDDDGRPLDYVSHLVLREGDRVVAEQDVRVNEPLRYGGMKFHQQSFGIAADVLVSDAAGATVFDGSVPLQWTSNDGTNVIGKFVLAEQRLEVLVITPASGATGSELAAGEAAFEVYDLEGGNEPISATTVSQGSPVALGDLTMTFEREREYTGILARQDPGAIWMWIGSALLVLGMMVTFICRHRRVWVRVDDAEATRIRFASADKQDLGFERQFTDLVHGVTSVVDERTLKGVGAEQ